MYTHNTSCRICQNEKLEAFLDLGKQPLANSFVNTPNPTDEKLYPLVVYFCRNCNLVQLCDIVDKEELFSSYIYFTSCMPTPKHFIDYAKNVASRFFLSPHKELVVEIGSNDGLLLGAFIESGIRVLGVDPAKNIAKVANERGIPTVADFFTEKLAKQIKEREGKAKIIIGNNVFAHINDINDVVRGIKSLLDKEGGFIFEAPYLMDMLENLAYDTIYHEHVSYLAIRPLVKLFEKFDLEIFNVELHDAQGNSIRAFVGHKDEHEIDSSVKKFIEKELSLKMNSISAYKELAEKIGKTKDDLIKLLYKLKKEGAKIAGYGAPAKGNTLLNYCGIGTNLIDYLTEELPTKIGQFSPGMHIPVIHIEESRKKLPDYFLMLAWNYKDKILAKEKEYRNNGGKFIIPIGGIEIL